MPAAAYIGLISAWVASAATPPSTWIASAPTAKKRVATAAPSAPVAGSRTRMDQVMRRIVAAPATRRKRARLYGMQPRTPITTDLVLLGAGHAHVEVLRRFAMRPEPGVRLTLIGREPETPYTGMLPGLIRGDYTFQQAHIDLAPLAAWAGARLILAEATGIDLERRCVAVAGRPDVPFDLLSIDVGGEPAMPPDGGQPVKPIGQFLDRLAAMEAELPARRAHRGDRWRRRRDGTRAGAGATLPRARCGSCWCATGRNRWPAAPAYARSVARTALVDAGVELVCGVQGRRLVGWQAGALRRQLPGGRHHAVGDRRGRAGIACGLRPGLRRGRLRARGRDVAQRQSCAGIRRRRLRRRSRAIPGPRPASGRCAPARRWPANLRRAARGQGAAELAAAADALAILGFGDGRALAWRNGVAVAGRS